MQRLVVEVYSASIVVAEDVRAVIEEREIFKERIRAEMQYNNIRLYPYDDDEHEDEERELNDRIRVGIKDHFAWFEGTRY